MKDNLPSPELLRKLLRYEPETGKLFWLPRDRDFFKSFRSYMSWNARDANTEAFTAIDTSGYKNGRILSVSLKAHRVIWAMQTGEYPKHQIDHIDHDRTNNKIENLRSATKHENMANRLPSKNSTSKYLGVYWATAAKSWRSCIRKNGKTHNIGIYKCEIEAAKAYDETAKKLHGDFANLNCP